MGDESLSPIKVYFSEYDLHVKMTAGLKNKFRAQKALLDPL
jgi:hypothetical protein